jgi:hypothetical protein
VADYHPGGRSADARGNFFFIFYAFPLITIEVDWNSPKPLPWFQAEKKRGQ